VLYPILVRHGFAVGTFAARPDDGLRLTGCRITNAVRCVPPANRPTPAEIGTCRRFLLGELTGPQAPRLILVLGRIAHESVLRALQLRIAAHPFAHGAAHELPGGRTLLCSFHSSRYNVNTGRLTFAMFDAVVAEAARLLEADGEQASRTVLKSGR
jgi:uracil-DNA glycosylase